MCKQVVVLPVLSCRPENGQTSMNKQKYINYRLIEEHSQTFNEGLFLPYCKFYNKCIWKNVRIFPLRLSRIIVIFLLLHSSISPY